jgi:thymidylate synthase (FAD)
MIPGGWVKLIDKMGSDLDVVNSARISYKNQHIMFEPGDDKLIGFLMKHRHGTPFEAVEFHFQVRAPISVVREWQRHRIASYNEVSGRYVKMELDSYMPARKNIRSQVGKPGHYKFIPCEPNIKLHVETIFKETYDLCYRAYETMLEMGVAKELARNVLNLGLFTEFRFKTNARSLMNFLELRNAPNAMFEIQEYARAIEEDFKTILPITHQAFLDNGRKAP